MRKKIGVYICHCGGNISDYVDVERVKQEAEKEKGVFLVRTAQFACADSSQSEMVNDIIDNELDGMVVASCSPKLHLLTFRAVSERAGLNIYNYVHANIREQVSWAHSDQKDGATRKAIQIIKASIAKVRFSEPLSPITVTTEKSIAVLGAGVTGLRSAIELANMGAKVYLIENSYFTGGRVAQWNQLNSNKETGTALTSRLYQEIESNKDIRLITGAELTGFKGSLGNFCLSLDIHPRYCEDRDPDKITKALEACPIEVSDAFNFGMHRRKAIIMPQAGQFPKIPAIDIKNCTRCGKCEELCDSVDLSQRTNKLQLIVGSVLVATGFDPYTPEEGELGYGTIPRVITLPQFVRLLGTREDRLELDGREIRNVAYIYCVGSRQPAGANKYCSRYCCTTAIFNASLAREKFKNIHNYHFTRGVRTYGKQESIYYEALAGGDVFFEFTDDEQPVIEQLNNKVQVKINDLLTQGEEVELLADLVVLVTGMVPRADNNLSSLLKIPKGRDHFFNEIHMKLRPVETVIDGITIAGTCQGPKNIMESVNSGLSAAIKSFTLVKTGELELEPVVAHVDENTCSWCDKCSNACPFDAIQSRESDGKKVALINQSVCKGCGMCLPVCPSDSIELTAYSNREIESMIDALRT